MSQTRLSEVINMAEKKAKPAAKAAKTKTSVKTKSGSAVAGKPKAGKAAATAPAKKTAVKKPRASVAKKAAAPAARTKAPPKEVAATAVKPGGAQQAKAKPTPEERYRMVEITAYFIAERHGFQGRSDEHWAAAEREIAAKLGY
jgi:hypothetical protein